MEINRIVEIDVDTKRNPTLLIRIVKSTPHREGIVPHEPDIKADMAVLTNALLCTILSAEKDGTYKVGEGIKKVIDNLQEGYVDSEAEVVNIKLNEQGIKEEAVCIRCKSDNLELYNGILYCDDCHEKQ